MDPFKLQNDRCEQMEADSVLITKERKDFFGDTFQVGDTAVYVLIYHRKGDSDEPTQHGVNLSAEITTLTPRSQILIKDEYDFGGMVGEGDATPRFYEKGSMPQPQEQKSVLELAQEQMQDQENQNGE